MDGTLTESGVARELAYRAVAERALRILASASIAVMPLKGILFAHWIYERPFQRLGGDIDLLVPERAYSSAIAALRSEGFRKEPSYSATECVLLPPGCPIEIDLHRSIFARGRFQLRSGDFFARGTPDRTLFGTPVVLPDPYDAYAHVIGHTAYDFIPGLSERIREDLRRLAGKFQLDAPRCARHLEKTGLARAARYTLTHVGNGDAFERSLLGHLRPDPLGAALAKASFAVVRSSAPRSVAARLASHLTNSSLPRAALCVAQALLHGAQVRLGLA
jgi:hypothetical protein